MAMTTIPSGLGFLRGDSAFRSVMPGSMVHGGFNPTGSASCGIVPVNSDLIPPALLQAFSIPRVDFDQAHTSAFTSAVRPPFLLPLPFMVRPWNIPV